MVPHLPFGAPFAFCNPHLPFGSPILLNRHVNHGVHIAYCDAPNNTALRFVADLGNDSLIP
jgi:hypothetical protein